MVAVSESWMPLSAETEISPQLPQPLVVSDALSSPVPAQEQEQA